MFAAKGERVLHVPCLDTGWLASNGWPHANVALAEAVAKLRTDVYAWQHPLLTASGADNINIALRWNADVYGGGRMLSLTNIGLVSLVIRVAIRAVLSELGVLG